MIFESYKSVILIHFKIAYGKQKTSKHKLRKCSSLRKYELILNLMAAMPHKEVMFTTVWYVWYSLFVLQLSVKVWELMRAAAGLQAEGCCPFLVSHTILAAQQFWAFVIW